MKHRPQNIKDIVRLIDLKCYSQFLAIALKVFLVVLLLFIAQLIYVPKREQAVSLRIMSLTVTMIALYALTWSVIIRQQLVKCYLFALLFPIAAIAVELMYKRTMRIDYVSCQFYWYLGGTSALVALTMLLMSSGSRRLLRWVPLAMNLLLFGAYLYLAVVLTYFLFTGIPFDAMTMVGIMQTDAKEAYHYFFYELPGGKMLLFFGALLAVLCWLAFHVFQIARKQTMAGEKRFPLLLLALLAGVACTERLTARSPLFEPILIAVARTPYLYSKELFNYQQTRDSRLAYISKTLAQNSPMNGDDGVFVLMIGESANRNFMSDYGYSKPTTPRQATLRTDPLAVVFDQVYSCHVITVQVLSLMLTDLNQYDGRKLSLTDSVSLIDIANYAGYRTRWFSNHEKVGKFTSAVSAIAAAASEKCFMENLRTPKKSVFSDAEMFDQLELKFQPRELIIFHLFGSHTPYGIKIPADFSCPDGFSSYEKSIYYTDYAVSEMVDKLLANGADVVLFVSDHSEDVAQGRMHDPRPDKFTIAMTEIPMWIRVSSRYAQRNPEVMAALQRVSQKPFTNDLIFNLMLAMMKINNEFTPACYNVLSDDYCLEPQLLRTLGGERLIFE